MVPSNNHVKSEWNACKCLGENCQTKVHGNNTNLSTYDGWVLERKRWSWGSKCERGVVGVSSRAIAIPDSHIV